MKKFRNSLVMAMTAGALAIVPASSTRTTQVVGRGDPDPKAIYSKNTKEFYLTAKDIAYIRPGLKITVNSITINSGLHPVVDVTYTDDLDQPLDRNGKVTAGPISMSLILAWYDAGARQYTSYTTRQRTSAPESQNPGVTVTQAAADSGGTWNDLDIGHSIYTFKTALPAGYDQTITTTLGIYATRNMAGIQDKNYYDNVEQDFVPNGAAVTQVWDEIANSACNTCHNPLSAHGGSRQDLKLCVLCHSPQTVNPDSGNTVDFKVMVHKIHMGESLPSVANGIPYYFYGRGEITDFSEVAFPQDIRNCTTCHAPPATQNTTWYTYPSQAACGACHDNINWTTGENHPAGVQPDSSCASCHQPVGDREWDASVQGAHTVPYESTQLKGLNAQIVSVTNTAPGQKPVVTFKLTENDGTILPPGPFTSNLNVLMGGPTTDYAINPYRERADGAAFDGTNATYTMKAAIPADATGTWAFSIEARRTVNLDPHPNDQTTFTEGAMNPVAYAAVDGGDARAAARGRRSRQLQHVPRKARPPRRAAAQHRRVRDVPQPQRERRLPPAGRRRPARVDRLQAHDPPHPHGRGAHADLHDLRVRHPPQRQQLQPRPLSGRPPRLRQVPHRRNPAGQREPAPGTARHADAARLVHPDAAQRGSLPRLPRHAARGRPRIRHDGALRRSLRRLPRRRNRLRGRQGSRSVGAVARPLLLLREGDRE